MSGPQYYRTTGIILKNSRTDDKRADLTVLTKDLGIIFLSKYGYGSVRNDSRSVLQPLNCADLYLEKKKIKYTLKECSISESFDILKKDYFRTVSAFGVFFSVMNIKVYDSKDYDNIFVLLKKYLEEMNRDTAAPLTLTAYFYFQLAWCLGFKFTVDKNSEGSIRYFRYSDGTFTSAGSVSATDGFVISRELFSILADFSESRFADIAKKNYITRREFYEFERMYKEYTGYHLGEPVLISAGPGSGEEK